MADRPGVPDETPGFPEVRMNRERTMAFGGKLKALRLKAGKSRYGLALFSGLTRHISSASKPESGVTLAEMSC